MNLLDVFILVIGIPVLIVYYVFIMNLAQRLYDNYESKRKAREMKKLANSWANPLFVSSTAIKPMK